MVYHSMPILGKHFPDWHPITNKATLKQMTTSRIPAEPVLSKGQEVAEQLRDLIAQQKLAPGERLRERDLAAQLSVSRTPMREALRLLAAEGLVEIHTNRGAIVANPGYEEIEDLLRLLGTLEGLAGEQAAERATDAEIADVNALHMDMKTAFEQEDRLSYYKLNQAIHHAIVAASKNAALIDTHAKVNARLFWVRYASNKMTARWTNAMESHSEILDALTQRDGARLSATLVTHMQTAWKNVRIQLRDNVTPIANATDKRQGNGTVL